MELWVEPAKTLTNVFLPIHAAMEATVQMLLVRTRARAALDMLDPATTALPTFIVARILAKMAERAPILVPPSPATAQQPIQAPHVRRKSTSAPATLASMAAHVRATLMATLAPAPLDSLARRAPPIRHVCLLPARTVARATPLCLVATTAPVLLGSPAPRVRPGSISVPRSPAKMVARAIWLLLARTNAHVPQDTTVPIVKHSTISALRIRVSWGPRAPTSSTTSRARALRATRGAFAI